jgi:hypothetical protein
MPGHDHRMKPMHTGHLNERNFYTYSHLSRGPEQNSKEDYFHVPADRLHELPEGFDSMHPEDKYMALNNGGFWREGYFNIRDEDAWDAADDAGHDTNELTIKAEEY